MDFDGQTDLFYDEAGELLELLEGSFLRLKESDDDPELLNTVFRAFHTIKGSSSMFGFDEISGFTHELESVFDRLRQTKTEIPASAVRICLAALDCIRALLSAGDSGEEKEKRRTVLQSLRAALSIPGGRNSSAAQRTGKREGNNGDPAVFRIMFRPFPDLLRNGCNPATIFSELRTLGECTVTMFTSDIPVLEDLDPEDCRVSWLILLSTDRKETEVRDAFIFVEDHAEITITRIETPAADSRPVVKKIGEILVEHGSLEPSDVEVIQAEQKRFGNIAVEKGLTDHERLAGALAEQNFLKTNLSGNRKKLESASIRVRNEKLDTLVNLVGELVTLQARFAQEACTLKSVRMRSLAETLGRLTDDLRSNAMSIRMVPVSETFNGFRRLINDLSETLSKKIRLEVSGGDTELDKNIMATLKDALMHLIRNSADHGIEPPKVRKAAGKPEEGLIRLSAEYEGPVVKIVIEDDGAGLDRETIARKAAGLNLIRADETDDRTIFNAIFTPGFSTAEKTTSVSGRGVGMDVVKKCVEKLRGTVELSSVMGSGTRVILSIPLTLAILEGLVLHTGDNSYILDLACVEECVDLTPDLRPTGRNGNLIMLRGEIIPFLVLREEFRSGGRNPDLERMVIVRVDGKKAGLVADRVTGKQQVVIKPLPNNCSYTQDIAGSAILGDGAVALILDAEAIVKRRYERPATFGK